MIVNTERKGERNKWDVWNEKASERESSCTEKMTKRSHTHTHSHTQTQYMTPPDNNYVPARG